MHHKKGEQYRTKMEGSHNSFIHMSCPLSQHPTDVQEEGTSAPLSMHNPPTEPQPTPYQSATNPETIHPNALSPKLARGKRHKTFPKYPDPHGPRARAPLRILERLRPSFKEVGNQPGNESIHTERTSVQPQSILT